jgi:hypothetical protein
VLISTLTDFPRKTLKTSSQYPQQAQTASKHTKQPSSNNKMAALALGSGGSVLGKLRRFLLRYYPPGKDTV